jgi:hypothetical protein
MESASLSDGIEWITAMFAYNFSGFIDEESTLDFFLESGNTISQKSAVIVIGDKTNLV